jgi:uncharacterized membrane protein
MNSAILNAFGNAGTGSYHRLFVLIEYASIFIEVVAVVIIVAAIVSALGHYFLHYAFRRGLGDHYREFKIRIGRSLLLGLEVLVAADIVRTVALEFALPSILGLGALVLIRTFLSWALVLEVEGHWPWQKD